jgi:phosphatidate cytidylyltransferase
MRSLNTGGASGVSADSSRAPDRDVVTEPHPAPSPHIGELGKRVASAVVLAALAVGAVAVGGWPFTLFWAAAALGIFWEWNAIVASSAIAVLAAGATAIAIAAIAAGIGSFAAALLALMIGALVAGLLSSPGRRAWGGSGVLYAGTALLAPVLLRRDEELGIVAIIFLFAVVWSTDILGYFVGRAVGGPKLAPRVSPTKTWSGACGGAAGAVVAAMVVMLGAGMRPLVEVGVIALALSIISQAGDLFESAVKRHFGVKDASHLIPGHGGLMDRLDGFIAASGVAALLGLARGGAEASARGLLSW